MHPHLEDLSKERCITTIINPKAFQLWFSPCTVKGKLSYIIIDVVEVGTPTQGLT